ncbi:VapC toxin family PIN domain ribonuclease [Streptomyces sp. NPDC054933]
MLRDAGTVITSPLVLAEVDHLTKARFGTAARPTITMFILGQRWMHFLIPQTTTEILATAVVGRKRYTDLDPSLADTMNIALATEYRTDAMLTLERRAFRAVHPVPPTAR